MWSNAVCSSSSTSMDNARPCWRYKVFITVKPYVAPPAGVGQIRLKCNVLRRYSRLIGTGRAEGRAAFLTAPRQKFNSKPSGASDLTHQPAAFGANLTRRRIRSVAHQQLRGTARDLKSGHAWRPAAPQSHSPGSEPSEVQFELVIPHTSTTVLSGASLRPGHQCASMQYQARLRSATL